MTLIELVDSGSARLQAAGVSFGHGTDNAFDEAVWLVLWCLGLPLDDFEGVAERSIDAVQQAQVEALVTRRIQTRQPAAYLTGEAWLQGLPFYVDERVIVPRSLIAEVIADGTIDAWFDDRVDDRFDTRLDPAQKLVLDLCTGNGSLAVLAALAWPEVQLTASDISADALAVAQTNVDRHALGRRIHLCQGDGLPAGEQRYDLILCNPPYVNRASMLALPAEYRAEPTIALDGGVGGGSDGMDFVRPLLRDAASRLNDEGVLVLEIGHERANFEAAFPRLEVVWLGTSAGDDQVLLLTQAALRSGV